MGHARHLTRATAAAVFAVIAAVATPLSGREPVRAEDTQAFEENQVKAAFLFNFAKFVEWPATDSGPLVIGVAGDEALQQVIDRAVRGRALKGREMATRRLSRSDDPSTCHVVFFASSLQRDANEMLQRTHGPILTVGETVQFLRDGGMVRLYIENNRVRFQINQKNAEAAGLKISSQLMTLAAP